MSDNGEIIPILSAAKLIGRSGKYDLGFVNSYLEAHGPLGNKNAFVGRVARNVFEQSSVGLIATHGDPNSNDDNLVIGTDFLYRTTKFMSKYTLEANLFTLGSYTQGAEFKGNLEPAFGAKVALPNDLFELEAGYLQIADEFNPALGFAPRTAIREYSTSLGVQPRPESLNWLR